MNSKPLFGFSGRFQATRYKVDVDGNPIESTAQVVAPFNNNLIVDNGLNLLRTVGNFTAFCRIGTGTAEPANNDNQLVAQVGATNTAGIGNAAGYDLTDGFLWQRYSRRFAAGTIHGQNLNEVAMAPAATGGIFCRALLKDAMGNPLTIVLLSDEVLDIVYELRMYLPPVDTVVEATIDGVATTVTMRRTNNLDDLELWAAMLSSKSLEPDLAYPANARYGLMLTALPSASSRFGGGSSSSFPTVSVQPYVADSHQTLVTINFGLTQGNVSPAAAMYMAGSAATDFRWTSAYGYWAYGFNPPLNKTSSRVAQVNVGISWGRYEPAP